MKVLILTITIYIPWALSLKDKRSETKKLIYKARNRFNISIIESDNQELIKTITLSISAAGLNISALNKLEESIISFIFLNTDGDIIEIIKDII